MTERSGKRGVRAWFAAPWGRRAGAPAVTTHAESVRALAAAMLRVGVWFGALAGLGALLVAAAFAGWPGLLGAGLGVAVGFASALFTIGLMRLSAPLPVEAVFGAVLGGYVVKIGLLLAVAAPLREIGQLDRLAFALSVLAVVVAWAVAEVVAFRRTPIPTIIPSDR